MARDRALRDWESLGKDRGSPLKCCPETKAWPHWLVDLAKIFAFPWDSASNDYSMSVVLDDSHVAVGKPQENLEISMH